MIDFSENESNKSFFEHKDVLIGTVKSKQQFYCSLNNNFYHMPEFLLDDHTTPIKYIALYQSVKLWEYQAGIYYYGEVESFQTLPRNEITEIPKDSDEMYVKFKIKCWKQLIVPIKVTQNSVYICEFTNSFLFFHSRDMYQLFLENESDFRLSALLSDAVNDIRINDENAEYGFDFEGYNVKFNKRKITVSRDNITKIDFQISEYISKPSIVFNSILNTIIK